MTRGSYGFIEAESLDEDVFYHMDMAGVEPTILEEGQEVEFEFKQTDDGPEVTQLRLPSSDVPDDADVIDDEIGGYWVSVTEFR